MEKKNFTAIIIDDELNSVKVLKNMIEYYCKQIEIIGTTTSSLEGLAIVVEKKPDILFLDIEMPYLNGFELIKKIQNQKVQVIFTTAYNEYAVNAIKVNALDYLLKPINPGDLIEAVAKIESTLPLTDLTEKINNLLTVIEYQHKQMQMLKNATSTNNILEENIKHWQLTSSEIEVSRLLADGNSAHEIAKILFRSRATIEKHTQNIYKKIGVNSRVEFVMLGLASLGLIDKFDKNLNFSSTCNIQKLYPNFGFSSQ